jgi:hypothetical protein
MEVSKQVRGLLLVRRRRSPSLFYLFTAGVEVVYFYLITLRHTPQSVDSSGRGIGPSQRLLPDYTNAVQETNIHAPCGIRTHDPSKRSALHPAATGTGFNGWFASQMVQLIEWNENKKEKGRYKGGVAYLLRSP